ncbi:hypothetical protein ACFYZB_43205 [Streptomyces sp. NPDC001852]|uniref:hypothetical protein n=1 Tax=Streptomyces sp. NPDC001852 TaxID=3364619 RepID=UPI0036B1BEC6
MDPGPLLFFIFGWFFALNIKGIADRTYQHAARFLPMIGGSATLRIMGWIWIFVGGTLVALDFLS